jgi:tRNA A-37 threonylcarbamoyl transferase component Bud32
MLSTTNTWNQHICIYQENRPENLSNVPEFVESLFLTGDSIKETKRSQLVRAAYGNERFVAKRYKTKKMRYLAHGLRHGRGSLPAWSNIFLLRQLGIPTLDPVLLLEQRFFRMPRESFLITREINGHNLSTYLENHDGEISESQLEKLRLMFSKFYDAKLIHGDLNRDNIMITENGPVLIDLDKLSSSKNQKDFVTRFGHEQDRFLRNLLAWPEAMERIRNTFPKSTELSNRQV